MYRTSVLSNYILFDIHINFVIVSKGVIFYGL
nr:MAG TPA: hypothetical protein [Caudoviricetes sp.]